MSRLVSYLIILLVSARISVFSQPAELRPEPPPQIEAPPDEPVEAPVKKPRKRVNNNDFRRNRHANALFGENVTVKAGDSIHDLILIGGTADIQGTVERDVVIIGGKAKVSGEVHGEFILVGGSLECSGELQRHAKVIMSRAEIKETGRLENGGLFIGGPFKFAPGATVMGERIVIPLGDVLPKIDGLKEWLVKGLLWGRLLPIDVRWVWLVAGAFAGIYFVTLLLFPAAIKAIFVALEERPVTSILSGFLTLILFAPLTTLLIVAVIGIPVVPFLQVALVLAILFGKSAVMCFLGRSFGRSTGVALLQAPFLAFLIGATLLVLAYMIPVFGVLAWVLATVFGLGGSVVAIARMFKHEEASVPPAPVLVTPGGAAAVPLSAAPLAPANSGDTLLLPRAGFWKRLLATLLDFVLLGLLAPFLEKTFLPVAVAYFTVMWAWRGTTIGSLLLRLKVVRTDGSKVTFPVALVRSLSSLFSILVFFLGFLWVAWDREKQSWHDKIAGTVVVQMPKGFSLL